MALDCTYSKILRSCLRRKGPLWSDCRSAPLVPLVFSRTQLCPLTSNGLQGYPCALITTSGTSGLSHQLSRQPGGLLPRLFSWAAPSLPGGMLGGVAPRGAFSGQAVWRRRLSLPFFYPSGHRSPLDLLFSFILLLYFLHNAYHFLKSTYFLNKSSLK